MKSVRQHFTNRQVVVRTDGTDVGDLLLTGNRLLHLEQFCFGGINRLFNTATHGHGIAASNDIAKAFFENGSGQDSRRRGPISREVRRLLSDLHDEFRTHILKAIFEFNLFRNGHPVLGHRGSTEGFVDDHVSARWTHCHCHCIGEFIDSAEHALSCMVLE